MQIFTCISIPAPDNPCAAFPARSRTLEQLGWSPSFFWYLLLYAKLRRCAFPLRPVPAAARADQPRHSPTPTCAGCLCCGAR